MRNQSMIGALTDFIDAGRIKVFAVNANSSESFYNKGAHPAHRSWMQRMYDEYPPRGGRAVRGTGTAGRR